MIFYRDSLREIETESKALPGGWCQIFGKPKGYELADDKWSTSVEYGKDADVNVNVKAKEEPAEEKTVEVYFNIIDSEKGSFPDYAPSTVVSFKGIAADTDQ